MLREGAATKFRNWSMSCGILWNGPNEVQASTGDQIYNSQQNKHARL